MTVIGSVRHFVGLVTLVLLVFTPAAADEGAAPEKSTRGPAAAHLSFDSEGRLQISDADRCPLCGMYPAKRPKSAAGMVLADGRTYYFCGNSCLLRAWHNAPMYLGVDQADIRRMAAQDYFSGTPVDAHAAWWVAGSDVIGPMGPALVALTSAGDVEQFKVRHGAKTIFQLDQLDEALWKKVFPPK